MRLSLTAVSDAVRALREAADRQRALIRRVNKVESVCVVASSSYSDSIIVHAHNRRLL